MTYRVLLFGDDMRIFLSLARAYGRKGIEVHAVPEAPHEPALTSKYVSHIHRVTSYAKSLPDWQRDVRNILVRFKFDLIVPCVDPAIIAFDQSREIFETENIAIPARDNWEVFFDKKETHEVCRELGIPVCREKVLNAEVTAESLAEEFGFPIILKPQTSYREGWLDTKDKVHVIADIKSLRNCLSEMDDVSIYMAEQFFEGSGVGVSVLAKDGEIRQAFQHRRLREGLGGCSSYRISEAVDPELREACAKLMKRTNHSGVCMFEFRFNRETGKWVLLETNCRFWGSMPLPTSLGVDFPNELLALHRGEPLNDAFSYPVGIRSRNYILDGFNLANTPITAKTFIPWAMGVADYLCQPVRLLTGAERNDSFVIDDIRPGLAEILDLPGNLIRKAGSALFKRIANVAHPGGNQREKLG